MSIARNKRQSSVGFHIHPAYKYLSNLRKQIVLSEKAYFLCNSNLMCGIVHTLGNTTVGECTTVRFHIQMKVKGNASYLIMKGG